ncbi:unnamed protein product [Didymodactylos carnosus]|uniref:Uncharacterized protein n=1 Tax=Didymodactylos carnosus TaxID=1234261 RepID=A0A8S2GRK9_9BILA|nr:unnamed protein product [Didymodactylos carnosus]CAF3549112.1 unnamed protein product [Didymodactylos carnosus]
MSTEIDNNSRASNPTSSLVVNPGGQNLDLYDITDDQDDFQTQLSYREKQKLKRQRHDQNSDELSSFTPKRNRNDNNNNNNNNDILQQRINENINNNQYATSSYFNTNQIYRKLGNELSGQKKQQRVSFPPFYIEFKEESKFPHNDVSIIKDINRKCKINLTYGRPVVIKQEKCYLLYADTTTQFDFLLNIQNWPDRICDSQYVVELPRKIPFSYSIVVKNIPAQWNVVGFGEELKQRYSTIVRAERLFINGGRPISKVRVDFSSNKELTEILKMKRILLDDDYTSYQIEPYVPPTRILRCYNHVYDRNCQNEIRCAHCQGGHMAGNPSCPVKIERRQVKIQQNKPSNVNQSSVRQQQGVWVNMPGRLLFSDAPRTPSMNQNTKYGKEERDMIEKINDTTMAIMQNQKDLHEQFMVLNEKMVNHVNLINDIICPLIREISNIIYGQVKGQNTQKITPLYNKLVNYMGKSNISQVSNENANVQRSNDENINSLAT